MAWQWLVAGLRPFWIESSASEGGNVWVTGITTHLSVLVFQSVLG